MRTSLEPVPFPRRLVGPDGPHPRSHPRGVFQRRVFQRRRRANAPPTTYEAQLSIGYRARNQRPCLGSVRSDRSSASKPAADARNLSPRLRHNTAAPGCFTLD